MPEYPLKPDPRADMVFNSSGFVEFQQKLPELYLKPDVDRVVHEHVDIVRKILSHSYFVYEFIDVAFIFLVISLEKALKRRYLDLTGKDGEKKSLNYLVDWARQEDLFEAFNTEILDTYRRVRNSKVHEATNTLGGLAYLKKMVELILFINDLYEDPTLRKTRKLFVNETQNAIAKFYKLGGILTMRREDYLIDDIHFVFYNNKHIEPVFSVFVSFIMMPGTILKYQKVLTQTFNLKSFYIHPESGIITGVEGPSNEIIQFTPLKDESDIMLTLNYRLELLTDIENGMTKKYDVAVELQEFYLQLWQAFQKAIV